MNTRSRSFKSVFRYLLFLLAGAAAGMLIGAILVCSVPKGSFKGLSFGRFLLRFLPYVLTLFVAWELQLILHEAGHLVFGLLSGYRFVSFRVGQFTLVRTERGLALRRLKLAGTAGQCLMAPPPYDEGRFPFVLYNLGGALMNLITGFLCALVSMIAVPAGLLRAFLLVTALIGLYFAAVNGIPLRTAMVANDGMNIRTMREDEAARRAFWLMLTVNTLQTEGRRLRDMEDDWFAPWPGLPEYNDLTAGMAGSAASRLLSLGKTDEAEAAIRAVLRKGRSLSGLYRFLLRLDLIYIDLMRRGPEADLTPLKSRENAAVLRRMDSFLSVLRVRYAAALLGKGDAAEAAQILARFERAAAAYPLPGEAEDERFLIALAREKAESGPAPSPEASR